MVAQLSETILSLEIHKNHFPFWPNSVSHDIEMINWKELLWQQNLPNVKLYLHHLQS